MADTKITALTAITTVDPANDVLPIVDVSDTSMAASGTTKKITTNQILGASGTATLASATITGALTAAGNSVIGTGSDQNAAAGRGNLTIGGTSSAILNLSINSADTGYVIHDGTNISLVNRIAAGSLNFYTNSSTRYQIASDGVATWSNVGGVAGTAMTLNSTGLGVGGSPAAKVHVVGGAAQNPLILDSTGYNHCVLKVSGTNRGQFYADATNCFAVVNSAGSATPFVVTDTGNVGIGVTPSAWGAGYKALQLGDGLSLMGSTINGTIAANAWFDGTNWKYISANSSAQYYCSYFGNGSHVWTTSTGVPSAGGTVSYNQAMTLDASGNLLLATTTNTPSARQYINQTSGSNPALYIAGGASTTPLINFNGAGRMRSDGQYLVMETTNASGVIYITANTNGVYMAVGGTSWTANSDERLKDIIEPISNAVSKVGSLRSVIGKFKNDETNTRRSFLIAQDVQAVLPEAVDASNPDRLGVAYSEVIPLLVAAIKELTARVQTLETR